MMKKYTTLRYIYALILCIMVGFKGFSQDPAAPLLPNINPPSPESFKFTEYGKNSANEFTGKLNASIPIYQYSAGKLQMPITLSYSGAGVKVEDIASWTGINWNLNVGGVINRQIRDAADEAFPNRPFIDEAHLKTNAADLCEPDSQDYWSIARYDSSYETEVDIFNFSFMGYSGSFYLDANFNPVSLENENEIRIQLIGSYGTNAQNLLYSKTFLITTPDGVKYYFGGSQTESTRVLSGARSLESDGVTSFFLYKIEHPVNGTIILEYDTLAVKAQHISKGYDMSTTLGENITYVSSFTERKFITRILDAKRIKKIKSPDSKIEVIFNRTDYMANHNYTSILNSISVINTDSPGTPFKKTNLIYDAKTTPQGATDFVNASRFFLMKVEIDKDLDTAGNKHEEYAFEYDDPFGLPERMSNKRDALGYYNGKPNTSLVTKDRRYKFTTGIGFADLNPSFTFGKKGSLKKIIYPTKGYSTFEYEPMPAKKGIMETYGFEIASYADNIFELPNTRTIPGDCLSPLCAAPYTSFATVVEDQTISFALGLTIAPHAGGSTALAGKGIEFIIRDLGTTEVPTLEETVYTSVFPLSFTNPTYIYELKKGHNYSFTLRFKDGYTSTDLGAIQGALSFEAFTGYDVIEGLGIRLKKDTNYNFDNVQTDSKRYYYGTIDGGYNNVALYPLLDYYSKTTYTLGGVTGPNDSQSTVNVNFASEIADRYSKELTKYDEKFPVVSISLGGDSFEKGGIEKYFVKIDNTKLTRIECISDGCWANLSGGIDCGKPKKGTVITMVRDYTQSFEETRNDYFDGKPLTERSYAKKNGELFKVREQNNHYTLLQDNDKKVTNLVARIIFDDVGHTWCYDPLGIPMIKNSMSSCYFGYYSTRVLSFNMKNTTTTEYLDPIPMSSYTVLYNPYNDRLMFNPDYDPETDGFGDPLAQGLAEASFRKIVTQQDYEYGTLRGLPTKITTTTSEGVVNSTVNIYVNQASGLPTLTQPEINAYAALLAQNNVVSPIQVQQYEPGPTLLSTQRTTYKQESTRVLPALIKTAKGAQNLEDRAVFEEYDNTGNPTLMSLAGGMKTKYLYNTRNQVIAKIENFTGTLDPNTKTISGNPCTFTNQYPNAVVTLFTYDPVTYLLIETMDSNCRKTTYVYDALRRLQQIKDHDGNIVKEFDTNYRPQ